MINWESYYFSVVAIVVLFYLYFHFNKVNASSIYLLPLHSLFSLFITIRDMRIGVDARSYYDFFDQAPVDISEPLFNLIRLINLPPEVYIFIISLLTTTLTFEYFKKIAIRPCLVMAFYLCTFVFLNSQINIIRQGLAMALLNYSLINMDRHKFKFIFFFILSIATHYSSMIILSSYLLVSHINKKTVNIGAKIILASVIIYLIDIGYIIKIIAEILNLGAISWYLSWGLGKPWQLKHVFYLAIPLFIYVRHYQEDRYLKEFLSPYLMVLSTFFAAMLFKNEEMFADRLIYYCLPAYLILLDVYLSRKKYSSLFISAICFIWLFKTSYLQLPSWFIYYE